MITSNAIALSWKEKASGAIVKAEYKFFPISYSLVQQDSLTSDMLKTLYNSQQYKYSIPSTYIVNYSGGNLPVDEYENTYDQNSLIESQVLSAGGIYIFYIYDNTGKQGTYHYVYIDNSPNTIISVDGDSYNYVVNNEVTTKDSKILFGKEKLIKINVASNATLDTWLEDFLTDENSLIYQNQKYLRIANNPKVYYSVNTVETSFTLSESNEYGIEINAKNANGEYNEHQYIFYMITEATKNDSIYSKDSFDFYEENYTGTHTLTFSTDNSAMRAFYINDGAIKDLSKLQTIEENGEKTNYFEPTSDSMFDILYFTYNVKPTDTMKVESVVLNYYAFTKSELNTTYEFKSEPTSIITLYEDGTLKAGEAVAGELNTYLYKVNLENYSNSLERTKAGKYEIVRTYTEDSVINANDPKVRNIEFIVDRNGLISEPLIDANGNSNYYVGSGIQLQIINKFGNDYSDTESGTLHYYDIYYATKLSQTSLVPVITTNFLPVTVYIPAYKYGYVVVDTEGFPKFEIENSIVQYIETDDQENAYLSSNYFKNYKLSAIVEVYENANSTKPIEGPYIFNKSLSNYNFLTASDSNTITSFNKEGFYRVTIKSDAGDKFVFVFQIVYASPEYEVLDEENTPLNSTKADGIETYYTNKNTVRLSWEDSPSEYLARINQNAISYTFGGNTYLVDKNTVVTAGENKYYVDVDISKLENNINAYYNNAEIKFTLQFNGIKDDYGNNSNYFSKTIILKVDLEAPVVNISNLISLTGLSETDLRSHVNGNIYNTSKTEGILRYFAYTVDVSNFTEVIKSPSETNGDYYETYYRFFVKNNKNTKYENETETNITTSYLTGLTSLWGRGDSFSKILVNENVNKYIEFVEEDYAGNRTVYTIYLTNIVENENKTAFTYTSLTNVASLGGATEIEYKIKDLKQSIDLYSKRSFSLNNVDFIHNDGISDLKWQIIKTEDDIFVKTPYSKGKYYKYNSNNQDLMYTIEELSSLLASGNSQKIEFKNVPVYNNIELNIYVLNKTLEYYKLSQVNNSNLYEGIIVDLPNLKNTENNILYATKLIIKASVKGGEYESTYEIDGANALIFKEEQLQLPSLNNQCVALS